ncbi:cell envelope integrity protein TolA [Leptospira sp. FAT2]|uniref:cell envelope integrity protein TolA n=1 Tax=Leptospira sanjuanensis TaxID=2879643 RepID=UPI001EE9111A|nr:cell envelope integrity protein TolA [Leptospira sanjuanensis]MCG6192339.1 cell envelope integrity protein TolA [Leptospira sanjuanensis]
MLIKYITQFNTGTKLYRNTVFTAFIGILLLLIANITSRTSFAESSSSFTFAFGFLISTVAIVLLIVSAALKRGPISIYLVLIFILLFSMFPQMNDSNFYSIWYDESPVTTEDSLKISGEIYTEGEVLVNGKSVERLDKKWSINYPLNLGENAIKVVLKRPSGFDRFSEEFKVERVTKEELARRKAEEKANQLASKKKAEEDAKEGLKEANAAELAEGCEKNPEKMVKIENFNWIKDEINQTYFKALVYNPCPIPLKDFRFHIEYFAPSGTKVDFGSEVVYDKLEPGKRKWMKFANSVWNEQATSVQLSIQIANKM